MIKSLKHWLHILGVIENNKITKFGEILYKKDLYLENSASIWIFHWNLVKNIDNSTLYYLLFNQFYFNNFTKDELIIKVQGWLRDNNIKNFAEKTLISDCEVLIKLYTNVMGLLSELNLLNYSFKYYKSK